MSGSEEPKTCCDRECAAMNDCIEGGVECDVCGRFYCSHEIDERGLCAECAEEEEKNRRPKMASENEEKRETSADIADEIRRAVESMGDGMPYTVSAGTMRRVADRIEAAWKREKFEIEAYALAVGGIVEAERHTPGNAAAMRNALVGIRALIADEPDGTPMIDAMKATIDAALSAPPRQCDVGTAEEQEVRFKRFCESHWDLNKPGSECAECPLDERVGTECEFAWAQMPYKAEEGGAE